MQFYDSNHNHHTKLLLLLILQTHIIIINSKVAHRIQTIIHNKIKEGKVIKILELCSEFTV